VKGPDVNNSQRTVYFGVLAVSTGIILAARYAQKYAPSLQGAVRSPGYFKNKAVPLVFQDIPDEHPVMLPYRIEFITNSYWYSPRWN
jgi:hypothetical protein